MAARRSAERAPDASRYALEGTLVPFLGAGTGVPIGLPLWAGLIQKMAAAAGRTDAAELEKMSPLDAAQVLKRSLADLHGRQAVVTGASSGLGVETAGALAAAGAAVTLAVRDVQAGAVAAEHIAAVTGRPCPQVSPLDLADPNSVAAFATGWDVPLDLLVNNAGLVTAGLLRSIAGWVLQLATNHLGHFALSLGLHAHLVSRVGSDFVVCG